MTSKYPCDRKRKQQKIPPISSTPSDTLHNHQPPKKKKRNTNEKPSTSDTNEHESPKILAKRHASKVSFMAERSGIGKFFGEAAIWDSYIEWMENFFVAHDITHANKYLTY